MSQFQLVAIGAGPCFLLFLEVLKMNTMNLEFSSFYPESLSPPIPLGSGKEIAAARILNPHFFHPRSSDGCTQGLQ